MQVSDEDAERSIGRISSDALSTHNAVCAKLCKKCLKERDDHQSHIGGLSKDGESYCGKA